MLARAAASAARRPLARHAAGPPPRVLYSSAKPSATGSAAIPLSTGVTAGGIAGVISALTGVGGGIILIPTLAKFTTLSQQVINGTSIGAVSLSASVGAYNHFDKGACNFPMALATTIPAIVCTRYGVRLAQRLTSKKLSLVVGAAMLVSSPLIFLKKSPYFPKFSANASPVDLQFYKAGDLSDPNSSYIAKVKNDPTAFAIANTKYLVAGALAGFISGLCGLGGGILMTAYLTAASDMPQETIIGTSLLGIVPTAVASTYHNVQAKSIHLPSAARVGGSLALGVYLTSKYVTHDVPEDVLRGILGTTLSAAAIVMMRRSI